MNNDKIIEVLDKAYRILRDEMQSPQTVLKLNEVFAMLRKALLQ